MSARKANIRKRRQRSLAARGSTIRSAGLRAALIDAIKDWYTSRSADERQLPLHNDHLLFAAARNYFERHATRNSNPKEFKP